MKNPTKKDPDIGEVIVGLLIIATVIPLVIMLWRWALS